LSGEPVWLSEDPRDPVDPARAEGQLQKAVEFAQLYEAAFVKNPAGAMLLKQWDKTHRRRRVPVNAPITEYAAVEAVRDFIEGIYGQIELAQTQGK
jgi:hypothetical protein